MSERNLLTALIVLLLPLSFGLDPRLGTKTPDMTGTGYFSASNVAPLITLEIKKGKPAARHSAIPFDFATISMRPQEDNGTFESSFETNVTHDIGCELSPNTTGSLENFPAKEDCCCTGHSIEGVGVDRFAISLPVEESFAGSDSSEDNNRTPGNAFPVDPGGRFSDTPISTPEPGSLAMLACGIIAIAGVARSRFVHARGDSRSA
jgi:hypothetical protein